MACGARIPTDEGKRKVYNTRFQSDGYGVWSLEGIDRYNELFNEMVHNRKKSWALGFEKEVMESL
jgi:hypothetical protein